MFLKKLIDLRHTLAFRLTLWYAGVFSVTAFLAFFFFYFFVTNFIRNQIDGDLINRMRNFSSLISIEGVEAGQRMAVVESQVGGIKKVFFRFLHRSGKVFSSSNMAYWKDIDINYGSVQRLIREGKPLFETVRLSGRDHEIRVLYGMIGPGVILQLGQAMEEYGRIISVFKRTFIGTMTFLVALAAFVGWFMARRALTGVEAVTRTAQMISRDALDMRVPVKQRGDEIDELASTFNEMLDRVEKLVTGMKEMSESIAHDLKSPITRIRGAAEITFTTGSDRDEYESMAASIIEECDRLLAMINTMLVISRVEAGVGSFKRERMDLAKMIKDACELFTPMGEEKNICVTYHGDESMCFIGDVGMIQRMISNLLDNSIKYTTVGGDVEVRTDRHEGHIIIKVKDTGIGISEEEMPHVFDRFYRGDASRSTEGAGLGLSFARAIARAHGGDITVESEQNKGSTFTVRL